MAPFAVGQRSYCWNKQSNMREKQPAGETGSQTGTRLQSIRTNWPLVYWLIAFWQAGQSKTSQELVMKYIKKKGKKCLRIFPRWDFILITNYWFSFVRVKIPTRKLNVLSRIFPFSFLHHNRLVNHVASCSKKRGCVFGLLHHYFFRESLLCKTCWQAVRLSGW